jgi:FixJ family two-component response regulator
MARGEDKTLTDAVHAAIDEHIEARRKDKAFTERLKERHERERELFERLAK